MFAPMGKSMQCDYSENCKKFRRFASKETFSYHLENHRQEVLDLWNLSKTCKWPGCKSRRSNTSFKTKGLFKKHLKTHIKVHQCDVEGCDYPTAFGTAFDLRRHQATAHSTFCNFFCTFNDCERNTLGFPRLDKLNEHIRDQHETFRCQFDHCRARVVESERESHINIAHQGNLNGPPDSPDSLIYECGFPGCAGTKSRFNYDSMKRHIIKDHEFSDTGYLAFWIRFMRKHVDPSESLRVVTVLYPERYKFKGHQHCLTCLQKKSLPA
ncbi:hypothetical protein B0O99DRAFT_268374 [Bisporella sp. PMI_857]|nr:hypothetical protein B0O99DRAFT_268374 [Bisporella sp. PMI_857]